MGLDTPHIGASSLTRSLSYAQSQRAILVSRSQLRQQYVMSGNIDVPQHPPGMPYVKVPPMGDVGITSPDGNQIGHVTFNTLPLPPPPPPTIIRFGDVGVAPLAPLSSLSSLPSLSSLSLLPRLRHLSLSLPPPLHLLHD